jgi:hypothetical protein
METIGPIVATAAVALVACVLVCLTRKKKALKENSSETNLVDMVSAQPDNV